MTFYTNFMGVFIAISLFLFNLVDAQSTRGCPATCVCFTTTVRCMFANLERVPSVPFDTTVLDLRFNKITELPPDSFKDLASLHTILLNNNQINKISRGVFNDLPELESLYLYKNKISEIEHRALDGLANLEQLFLHHNNIKHLPSGLFRDSTKLSRLRLDANPLVCDCDIVWLANTLQGTSSLTHASGTCGSPSVLNGRSLTDVSTQDIDCKRPHFTSEPRDVDVTFGSTAYFSCHAEGDPAPEILWLHNSNEVDASSSRYSILDDGTLMIHQTENSDQGFYECLARNSAGEIKTNQVELRYLAESTAPQFTSRPSDSRVSVGSTMRLTCTADGQPDPEIRWTKNGNQIVTNRRTTVLASGTLVIGDVQQSDRGQYRCTATNTHSSVSADARLIIQNPPTFLTQPRDKTVVEGESVRMKCEARGSPAPVLSWTKDGAPLPNDPRYSLLDIGKTLNILRTERADAGTFTCQAENSGGRSEVSAELVISSQIAPTFTRQSSDINAILGSDVELQCLAQGDPRPRFRWLKDGEPVRSGGRYRLNGNVLNIDRVHRRAQGVYECIAENSAGAARSSIVLWVRERNNTVTLPTTQHVRNTVNQVIQNVDNAITTTRRDLFDTSRVHSVQDMLQLVRYPTQSALHLARAAEVFEQTLITLHAHVRNGHRYNLDGHDVQYDEVASPALLSMIANMSGCFEHRIITDCSDMCFHKKYRAIDGVCNNLVHTEWGAANTAFRRILDPIYENGFNTPVGWDPTILYNGHSLPSARLVSITMMSTPTITPEDRDTHMVMQWGQFVDHDVDLSPPSVSNARFSDGERCNETCENRYPCFPIPVASNDPRIHRHRCIGMARTSATCASGTTSIFYQTLAPRQQLNLITSYIDASNVYGSNSEWSLNLRDLSNARGLLRVGPQVTTGKSLLPYDTQGVTDCQVDANTRHVPCFLAGDARVNEQLSLTSMHTLWMREHNRIANELLRINPHWDHHMLYHETRKIIGALMQHITYTEWLPQFLGPDGMRQLGDYTGYDPSINASVSNEFATAAYRVGHTMIQPVIYRLNSTYQPIPEGNLPLHRAFFAPFRILEEGGIDPLLRGMIGVAAKKRLPDELLNSELTENLFSLAHDVGLDLAALNIQRGRDHGLPSYNAYRDHCGLIRARAFSDLRQEIPDWGVRNKLRSLYGHVDNIDLFVGALSEAPLDGSKHGPVLLCLLVEQFKRLRAGDRFWYENADIFSPGQVAQLKQMSLARVICTSSDGIDEIQRNAFAQASYPADLVPCDDIPRLDVKLWAQCCDDCSSSGRFNSAASQPRRRRSTEHSYPHDKPLMFNGTGGDLKPELRGIFDKPEKNKQYSRTILDTSAPALPSDIESVQSQLAGMEGIISELVRDVKFLKRQIRRMSSSTVPSRHIR